MEKVRSGRDCIRIPSSPIGMSFWRVLCQYLPSEQSCDTLKWSATCCTVLYRK